MEVIKIKILTFIAAAGQKSTILNVAAFSLGVNVF